MVTMNNQALDHQIKTFKQSSSFTSGDALSFVVRFTDVLSLPGKYDPADYLRVDPDEVSGRVAVICPANGGLCVELIKRGSASVSAFEPRNIYHKSIAKVAEFCKASLGRTYGYSTTQSELEPDAYDLIVWSEGLDEIRDPAEFFRSVLRSLKPGGAIYIEVAHGAHGVLPKSTNAWRPTIDAFESTIAAIGGLTIEAKRPGRNQLRLIYKIVRAPVAGAQTSAPAITLPAVTSLPEERPGTISQEESQALFGGPGTVDSAIGTPKRRGRKSKPDEQSS